MIQSSTDRPGRLFRLRVKSTLASLYFALMFFVLGPAAILYLTREEPLATAGGLTAALGLLVVAGANLFVVRHVALFIREGDGTHVPIDPPRRFVQSHAYQRLRNPMYLAYVVTAFGEAIFFASAALAVYAAALGLIAHLYVVLREEPLLLERFGEEYEGYCRRVPRWGFGRRSDRSG
jgi:protein-S-isoprenylcysteine O-methyltransferase Ste14